MRAWLSARRSLGERDDLRGLRMGLERGVKGPLSKEDFWIAFMARECMEGKEESGALGKKRPALGKKPEAIRRALIRELLFGQPAPWFDLSPAEARRLRERLKATPRQNFHRWLRRLGAG